MAISQISAPAHASEAIALSWSATDPINIPAFMAIERPKPTVEIPYGSEATQTVDLFVPDQGGPFPVVVLIHGGCWSAKTAGREQVRHLGADLAKRGIAVWSIGYRRADETGGGYPGTYQDVATAIDLLREQAPRYRLDLSHTVLVGHSAGGHLALWAAGRDRLSSTSRLHVAEPFVPRRVVALAGVGNLKTFSTLIPGICGQGILENLVAASTTDPDAFTDISPSILGATDARVVMISGVLDRLVPPYVAHDYAISVRSDLKVELVNVEGAGHFDLVTTGRRGWEIALANIESALAW
jgi:acetyl esterase/lipase